MEANSKSHFTPISVDGYVEGAAVEAVVLCCVPVRLQPSVVLCFLFVFLRVCVFQILLMRSGVICSGVRGPVVRYARRWTHVTGNVSQMPEDASLEQRMLKETVRKFAENRVAPIAEKVDHENKFPMHLWKVSFWS